MGCGSSSHLPKRDTRSQSQVTVAAQQRAEAAYRRQRMAQERAEQTAVWRAEMEVERARILKEMSGGDSRRPSYCKELDDLKEQEVSNRLNEYLQEYKVGTRNARNCLPVNGYPHSTVIIERRGSREEREKRRYSRQREGDNDKNGPENRRLSTGEKIDLDFLRIIANRSSQASPSNVQIEENVQDRDDVQNSDTNAEVVANVLYKENNETESVKSKINEDETINEKKDVIKEDRADNRVDSKLEVAPIDNKNESKTYEHPTLVHDNRENDAHKNLPKQFRQKEDVNDHNRDDNNKASEISKDCIEEQSKNSDTVERKLEEQVEREMAEKLERREEVQDEIRAQESKDMEQQREASKESEETLIPVQEPEETDKSNQQPDEKHHQIYVSEEQGDKEKERSDIETINEATSEIKSTRYMESVQGKTLLKRHDKVTEQDKPSQGTRGDNSDIKEDVHAL